MTELQYVETIRKAAEAYVTIIGDFHTANGEEYWRWLDAKSSLSPWTAIELCDAWLEKNLTSTERST